jgi:hypothetical protein
VIASIANANGVSADHSVDGWAGAVRKTEGACATVDTGSFAGAALGVSTAVFCAGTLKRGSTIVTLVTLPLEIGRGALENANASKNDAASAARATTASTSRERSSGLVIPADDCMIVRAVK